MILTPCPYDPINGGKACLETAAETLRQKLNAVPIKIQLASTFLKFELN